MTRSEAAKICQSIKFILENSDYTEAVEEALNMAIEALQQEPTAEYSSDIISRQGAIDALYDKGLSMTAWGELLAMKWSDIQTCIELLPSADRPTGHWIEKEVFDNQDSEVIESYQSARCSHCGKYHTTPYSYFFDNYNFCPNCGSYNGGDTDGSD